MIQLENLDPKGRDTVSVNREELKRIIDQIPEQDAVEVADFIGYLHAKRERETLKNLESANVTSMEFWDNQVDDEVWNNV
ncbi:MAG: hypothetical protein JWR03_2222 [Cohnella sp.]|jgi:hypothetical protein|nr:hypothetical protein [Cohnella sp.]